MLDYAAVLWPALAAPWPRAAAITLFALVLTVINLRGVTRGALARQPAHYREARCRSA